MFRHVEAQSGLATYRRAIHRRRWWIYLSVFLCWSVIFVWKVDRSFKGALPGAAANSQEHQLRDTDPPPNSVIGSRATRRFLISIGSLFLGLALGIGFGGLAELKDERLQQAKQVEGLLSVSILVGIPHLGLARERRNELIMRWIERGAVAAMLLLIMAGNLSIFLKP